MSYSSAPISPRSFKVLAHTYRDILLKKKKKHDELTDGKMTKKQYALPTIVKVFVLRFHGPVNPIGSSLARSVWLTTLLLGRLSPLIG